MSPSPRKKNSWKDDNEKLKDKSLDSSLGKFDTSIDRDTKPKIPLGGNTIQKSLNNSTLVERTNHHLSAENTDREKGTQSMVNLEAVKKIKVIRIEKPAQNKYRRVEDKDKVLLDFLGVTY